MQRYASAVVTIPAGAVRAGPVQTSERTVSLPISIRDSDGRTHGTVLLEGDTVEQLRQAAELILGAVEAERSRLQQAPGPGAVVREA